MPTTIVVIWDSLDYVQCTQIKTNARLMTLARDLPSFAADHEQWHLQQYQSQ